MSFAPIKWPVYQNLRHFFSFKLKATNSRRKRTRTTSGNKIFPLDAIGIIRITNRFVKFNSSSISNGGSSRNFQFGIRGSINSRWINFRCKYLSQYPNKLFFVQKFCLTKNSLFLFQRASALAALEGLKPWTAQHAQHAQPNSNPVT